MCVLGTHSEIKCVSLYKTVRGGAQTKFTCAPISKPLVVTAPRHHRDHHHYCTHIHTHRAHSNILRRDRRRRRRLIVCFKNQFLGERAANVFISLKETIIPILAMLQRRASLYAERVCIV